MRRLPPQSLASIPISTRRAAAAAALSIRFPPPAWQPLSNRNRSPHSAASSSSSSSSSSTTPPTDLDDTASSSSSTEQPRLSPFRFETGVALFAKRPPRPFPPPFLSAPSGSFSDPLSTHHGGRRSGAVRGATNGDDAVYAGDAFVCANDGVGAWSTRPKGNAGLWARLILHYWVAAIQEDVKRLRSPGDCYVPDPVEYLQRAYEQTIEATGPPNDWQGTTTVCGAQLHYQCTGQGGADRPLAGPEPGVPSGAGQAAAVPPRGTDSVSPLLYIANLGDSQVMVVRPSARSIVFKTTEQWHWFDCPRQLGTNSPDTPRGNAIVDKVPIMEGDVVLAMTDGVIDNLWAHEIAECVSDSVARWETGEALGHKVQRDESAAAIVARKGGRGGGMRFVAEELMEAAKAIALDPFAQSPFMEHAIEEGLASEGGKLDDISVVAALCTRRGA